MMFRGTSRGCDRIGEGGNMLTIPFTVLPTGSNGDSEIHFFYLPSESKLRVASIRRLVLLIVLKKGRTWEKRSL